MFMVLCVLCALVSCSTSPRGFIDDDGNEILMGAFDDEELELFEQLNSPVDGAQLPFSAFGEIWAYVVSGNENALKSRLPLSDVVYFGAEVSSYGHLENVPKRTKLKQFAGKVHMSIACNSAGLTHFVIEPESKARRILIDEILTAVKPYDGLNIDMELVPLQDAEVFLQFLAELRSRIGYDKLFSVCVPARTKASKNYDYEKIAFLSDRVFVMAYDEHWSTSAPGPVASMVWCKNVAQYAMRTIGAKKLVMGVPFYGRAWGDTSTSRALINATTERLKKEHGVEQIRRVNGVPSFSYDVKVKVTVYYEDEFSIATRIDMYNKQGVQAVGFWRLGQEPNAFWSLLSLNRQLAGR
ncbi:MAG: glycoside hydrolase [Spirochaetaceae bacterium]|nr:glycoside hydrolase [Spirochaetaceae bacterium]